MAISAEPNFIPLKCEVSYETCRKNRGIFADMAADPYAFRFGVGRCRSHGGSLCRLSTPQSRDQDQSKQAATVESRLPQMAGYNSAGYASGETQYDDFHDCGNVAGSDQEQAGIYGRWDTGREPSRWCHLGSEYWLPRSSAPQILA